MSFRDRLRSAKTFVIETLTGFVDTQWKAGDCDLKLKLGGTFRANYEHFNQLAEQDPRFTQIIEGAGL